jgi:AraC-like DNA-binding protein
MIILNHTMIILNLSLGNDCKAAFTLSPQTRLTDLLAGDNWDSQLSDRLCTQRFKLSDRLYTQRFTCTLKINMLYTQKKIKMHREVTLVWGCVHYVV